MLKNLYIRVSTREDAKAIAHLSTRTFRDTFTTDSNTADIEAYLKTTFQVEQIAAELADNRNTFLLACAESSADPIGYAKLRVGKKSCISSSNPIELERLYVNKSRIGQGVGAKLMQTCLDRAALQNRNILWLGVWENNLQAIKFYEKWNFTTVGSHVFKLGSDNQNDLIMQRPIKLEH